MFLLQNVPHLAANNDFFIIKEFVFLKIPPEQEKIISKEPYQYTVPDLHGNGLKLLHTAIMLNFLKASPRQYQKIQSIYFSNQKKVTKETLSQFKHLIRSLQVQNKKPNKLLLIGDEFGDRGMNDYYTLEILAHMVQQGVSCEILISNHGYEFVQGYEKNSFTSSILKGNHALSLQNLRNLIDRNIVSSRYIHKLINEYYKKCLKLISCSYTENQVFIFSHAPIGLKTVMSLAKKLNVPYLDDSPHLLMQTINQINKVFFENYVRQNKVHTLFDPAILEAGYCGYKINPETNPFEHLIWNRDYEDLDRPFVHKQYNLNFVHGHDATPETEKNIYNLDGDNLLGKSIHLNHGLMQVLATKIEPTA